MAASDDDKPHSGKRGGHIPSLVPQGARGPRLKGKVLCMAGGRDKKRRKKGDSKGKAKSQPLCRWKKKIHHLRSWGGRSY